MVEAEAALGAFTPALMLEVTATAVIGASLRAAWPAAAGVALALLALTVGATTRSHRSNHRRSGYSHDEGAPNGSSYGGSHQRPTFSYTSGDLYGGSYDGTYPDGRSPL